MEVKSTIYSTVADSIHIDMSKVRQVKIIGQGTPVRSLVFVFDNGDEWKHDFQEKDFKYLLCMMDNALSVWKKGRQVSRKEMKGWWWNW